MTFEQRAYHIYKSSLCNIPLLTHQYISRVQIHYYRESLARVLLDSCQTLARLCQTLARLLPDSCQTLARLLPDSCLSLAESSRVLIESGRVQVDSVGASKVHVDSTVFRWNISLCGFFHFYQLYSGYILDHSRLFQIIAVGSHTVQLKIATIFILDIICQYRF